MSPPPCYATAYTMTWYEEIADLKRARCFLPTNKKPLKSPPFGGTTYKICMLCMFRCVDTILFWKWLTMNVGKSKIVWSGNNGCHMSQENVTKFWAALHPWFPNSYSVLRFPEQGWEIALFPAKGIVSHRQIISRRLYAFVWKEVVHSLAEHFQTPVNKVNNVDANYFKLPK